MEMFDPEYIFTEKITPSSGGANSYKSKKAGKHFTVLHQDRDIKTEVNNFDSEKREFLLSLGNFSDKVPVEFDYDEDLSLKIMLNNLIGSYDEAERVISDEQLLIRRLKKYEQLPTEEFGMYVTAVAALYQESQRIYKAYAQANKKIQSNSDVKYKKSKKSECKYDITTIDEYGRQVETADSYRYGYFIGEHGVQPAIFHLTTQIITNNKDESLDKYDEFDEILGFTRNENINPEKSKTTNEQPMPVYKIKDLTSYIAKDVESERIVLYDAICLIERNLKILGEPFAKHVSSTAPYDSEIYRVYSENLVRWPIVRAEYKELIEETHLNLMLIEHYFTDWNYSEPIDKQTAKQLEQSMSVDYPKNYPVEHRAINLERPESLIRTQIATKYPKLLKLWDDTTFID